jgi:hypothetical protein
MNALKLTPLGDPNAVVCEDDVCVIPGAAVDPEATVSEEIAQH